jgi:molybdenum cofactor biosynthesis enzyme MoaA
MIYEVYKKMLVLRTTNKKEVNKLINKFKDKEIQYELHELLCFLKDDD